MRSRSSSTCSASTSASTASSFATPWWAEPTAWPGRPARNTASAFLLSGFAPLCLAVRVPRRYVTAQLAALAAGFFAIQPLLGYVYEVGAFYGFGRRTPTALHTSLGIIVLVLGMPFARPDRGLMRTIMAPDLGGYVAQRLLPAAILVPVLLGLLRIAGAEADLFGVVYGLTLVIGFTMVAFVALVWWNAGTLHRLDPERSAADRERDRALTAAETERAYSTTVLDQMAAGVIIADAKTGRLILGNPQVETIWRQRARRQGAQARRGRAVRGRVRRGGDLHGR